MNLAANPSMPKPRCEVSIESQAFQSAIYKARAALLKCKVLLQLVDY